MDKFYVAVSDVPGQAMVRMMDGNVRNFMYKSHCQ